MQDVITKLAAKAENGDCKAAFDLGIYFEENCPNKRTREEIDDEEYIVPSEYVEALKWYIIADYAADYSSMDEIAAYVRWIELEHIEMDDESAQTARSLAKNWFYETAEKGKKWPQYWLGNLYETGHYLWSRITKKRCIGIQKLLNRV